MGVNPDQRMSEDAHKLCDLSTDLSVGLFRASVLLVGFAGVLWNISNDFEIRISGIDYRVPGFMLWAASHILARGDLRSLIFFGGLLLVAALGTILMDARKRRNPDFARFAAVSSNVPFAAVAQGRNRIVWREIGWIRPAAGLALFFVVLLVHP